MWYLHSTNPPTPLDRSSYDTQKHIILYGVLYIQSPFLQDMNHPTKHIPLCSQPQALTYITLITHAEQSSERQSVRLRLCTPYFPSRSVALHCVEHYRCNPPNMQIETQWGRGAFDSMMSDEEFAKIEVERSSQMSYCTYLCMYVLHDRAGFEF